MRIFVSHSGRQLDNEFAVKLAARLEHLGCDVWIDRHHLLAGGSVIGAIRKEIQSRPFFVVVLSPSALASPFVEKECTWAFSDWDKDPTRVILPVVLEGVEERNVWGSLSDFRYVKGDTMDHLLDETAGELAQKWLSAAYPSTAATGMVECALRGGFPLGELVPARIADSLPVRSRVGTEGYRRAFENGWIYWSKRGGARPVWGAIGHLYHHSKQGPEGLLGFPLTGEMPAVRSPQGTDGVFQRFEGPWDYPSDVQERVGVRCGATVYWSEAHGAWPVRCGIGIRYERLRGTGGPLGFPVSDETPLSAAADEGEACRQDFEGGSIYWCEKYDAVAVIGAANALYTRMGGPTGQLGFPVSATEPIVLDDRRYHLQRFAGGVVCIEERSTTT